MIRKEKKDDEGFILVELQERLFEEMKKKDGHRFITIIDGQHRIRGVEVAIERLEKEINLLVQTMEKNSSVELSERLESYRSRLSDLKSIELVVSFFIDKTLEYQAMIFSTINRTQKRVSPDLVSSLFGLDKRPTPQRTALQVVLKLNGHRKSPFYKRIKLYGGDYDEQKSPPLSQATMVRSIVGLICENLRESENDRYRKRKDLLQRTVSSNKFLPFRKYYANDDDSKISDIIYYFFSAVREVFTKGGRSLWNLSTEDSQENIFHTAVGYDTLLKICVDILELNPNSTYNIEFFREYVRKARFLDIQDQVRYSFNNRGKRILYLDFSLAIWPPDRNDKNDKRQQMLSDLMGGKD